MRDECPFTRAERAIMAIGADDPTEFGFEDMDDLRDAVRDILTGNADE